MPLFSKEAPAHAYERPPQALRAYAETGCRRNKPTATPAPVLLTPGRSGHTHELFYDPLGASLLSNQQAGSVHLYTKRKSREKVVLGNKTLAAERRGLE